MQAYLGQHPDIFMPASNIEPHFFGTDLSCRVFIRDEQAYLSLFERATDEKRVGEKSVRYLYSKLSAAEIKAFVPSASIIIMLRNPVDQICSLHSFRMYYGMENLADLEEALEAEDDRRRGLRIPNGWSSFAQWCLYRDTARYSRQVQRYLDAFGRENVHIIIFDDFVGDTAGAYKDTLQFLGVYKDFPPAFKKINAGRGVRSIRLQNFLRRSAQFVRPFEKFFTKPGIRQRVAKGVLYLNSKALLNPPIRPELRRRLQREFLPEVEQLSELLGSDLTHWCRPEA